MSPLIQNFILTGRLKNSKKTTALAYDSENGNLAFRHGDSCCGIFDLVESPPHQQTNFSFRRNHDWKGRSIIEPHNRYKHYRDRENRTQQSESANEGRIRKWWGFARATKD